MPERNHNSQPSRLRASRACQACSARKVRCDATEVGIPCSRCRTAQPGTCHLVPSRRGTYLRKSNQKQLVGTNIIVTSLPSPTQRQLSFSPEGPGAPTPLTSTTSTSTSFPDGDRALNSASALNSNLEATTSTQTGQTDPDLSSEMSSQSQNSLKCMFEKFLEQQSQNLDESSDTCGFIFMSSASPLTFALKEARDLNNKVSLQDADTQFSNTSPTGTLATIDHPKHLAPRDLTYLDAKGAFERQPTEILEALFTSFTERFYPLYSIVDIDQWHESCQVNTIPWILLHAVCYIGATFCDGSVLHKAGFKNRWHARRHFYDKAKILFDLGYETNKIVLLQSVIMLSFWGPQMKSYWNPCSWIGFGVTIAESLGIHRLGSAPAPKGDMGRRRRSLLKRLFWALAIRDAYCAALLGRPCRLNIAQCNTELLSVNDFEHQGCESCSSQQDAENDIDHDGCHIHAYYQIQVARLSLIIRNIIGTGFGACKSPSVLHQMNEQLEAWREELPSVLDWDAAQNQPCNTFVLSLMVIYHFQLILVHLEEPEEPSQPSALYALRTTSSSSDIVEAAAYKISSASFTIISNSLLGALPHECFPGFFIAGIVFYRSIKPQSSSRPRSTFASNLSRSALDNCQMVISEARERWDPSIWILKIFDFLLSAAPAHLPNADAAKEDQGKRNTPINNAGAMSAGQMAADATVFPNAPAVPDTFLNGDGLHPIAFNSPDYQDMTFLGSDFFPMSNYLPMSPGNTLYWPTQ